MENDREVLDREEIRRRGLIFTGRHLPYNPRIVERAKVLRKNMTPAEKKLWLGYLRGFRFRVLPQRPIDNYIVDFYCPALKLVIEIDGESHRTEEGKRYDEERDAVLSAYGLETLRVSNEAVLNDFDSVCGKIEGLVSRLLPSDEDER